MLVKRILFILNSTYIIYYITLFIYFYYNDEAIKRKILYIYIFRNISCCIGYRFFSNIVFYHIFKSINI